MSDIGLDKIIAPSFYKLHWDVLDEKHTHYWLKGGRGSTKSTFVSIEIIYGMMQDPNANAVAIRKVAEYLNVGGKTKPTSGAPEHQTAKATFTAVKTDYEDSLYYFIDDTNFTAAQKAEIAKKWFEDMHYLPSASPAGLPEGSTEDASESDTETE